MSIQQQFLKEEEGGLNLTKCSIKSKGLFIINVIKLLKKEEPEGGHMSSLIGHHNPLNKLKSNNYPKKETTPQILREALVTIRDNIGIDWTKTTAKDLYHAMLAPEKIRPRIKIKFPERNHEQIFKNCTNQYLPAPVRDHVFRKIHDLLPTKQRLKRCGYVNVDGCPD